MRTYRDKEELKAEIEKSYKKYILEFDSIPEALKSNGINLVNCTNGLPIPMVSYPLKS